MSIVRWQQGPHGTLYQILQALHGLYGGTTPISPNFDTAWPRRSLSKRDTGHGSVPLTDDNSALWYGTISVGTPAEPFTGMTLSSGYRLPSDPAPCTVDFDTGSSDLFVPSERCGSSCSGHKKYDPLASSTSHDLGKNFTLLYGDNSTVSGEQCTDNVTIAGLEVRRAIFFFSFPTIQSAHMSHHRRSARRLVLQPFILKVIAVPTSQPMA
jgi:hypothetical protein